MMDNYIGKTLDNRYELLEIIGTGGMAVVYKAMCHRLNRLVAIKILKEEYSADEDIRRRFQTESQAVAMLSHSNIVSIYDVNHSDNLDYIVMELLDGLTLKEYITKVGKLDWHEALHYASQVLSALSHAHSRGIIHRDIKPHNIMILHDGSIKVTDFGIAHLAGSQQVTLTQQTLGSVHYISPEQAKGEKVDARSDIYSVGVVMYEMLTGKLPFEGDSAVSVALQHINSTPVPPRNINPKIPIGLEEIVIRAMASERERRYGSADEMLADLEELRKNQEKTFAYENKEELSVTDEPTRKIPIIGKSAEVEVTDETKPKKRNGITRDEYYYRRKRTGRVAIFAGTFLVLVLIVFLGMKFKTSFLDVWLGHTEKIQVPTLVGSVAEDVIKAFQNDPDFTISVGSTQASSDYEEGYIIEQSPVGGSSVESGTKITVIVSSGREYISMPDVQNMEYHKALVELQRLGLQCEPDFVSSEDVDKDLVISQIPEQGAELNPNDRVYLVVSSGAVEEEIPMPYLVGLTYDVASQRIAGMGLAIGITDWVYDDDPEGTVIFQSIVAGTSVSAGTAVNLQISKGPLVAQNDEPSQGETDTEREADNDETDEGDTVEPPHKLSDDETEIIGEGNKTETADITSGNSEE